MTNTSVTKLMSVVWIATAMLLLTFQTCIPMVTLAKVVITIVMLTMSIMCGVLNMTLGKVTGIPWVLHCTPAIGTMGGIIVMELVVEPMPFMPTVT